MLSEEVLANQPPFLVVLRRQDLEWKLEMENHSVRSLRICWGGKRMKSCLSILTAFAEGLVLVSKSSGRSEKTESIGGGGGGWGEGSSFTPTDR